ncbi:ABC transporter permease subunit [Shimia sp. R11_0]|uniref:amino acid ABC transporter permease n=1 Tax=Shimia sp. R11_0 TaxID=2821096 RepID=UPI001ADC3880|nr:ABC transporter permease subunit [Shimia sp. R11_0]MBO9476788.1 ABC transporter permease subunit [Shimia sp. R11_0]
MTNLTDPPRESFRLSMLLNDTRYRSLTFQAIAAIVLALAIWELGGNLAQNLRAAGLNISLNFMSDPAGYDINQRLIEYDSQSSHARAALVGILNTLLVAFLACVTATVFGVIAGVLRLSNNWLVSKVMAFYVEIFRNIPVLIWILIIYTIMTSVMPGPRAFRGDNATSSMLFDMFAFTNRGIYIPMPWFESGIFGNPTLNWLLVIAGLIGSWIGARSVTRWANQKQEMTGQRPNTLWIKLAIWLVPFVLLMVIMGLSWEIPALKGFNFKGGIKIGGPLIALWFALSIYTGAFIAENVRAGIQAVSKGQTEAAAALGLRANRVMNLVILPQALRVIIPPLISNYLNITKNTSLAILVGYADITATLGGITLNQTGRAIECVLLLMLFYLTASLLISMAMNIYNSSVKLKER